MRGQIEGRFLFSTAVARHLVPFALLPAATVALPIEADPKLRVRTAAELAADGYRDFSAWMEKAENLWKKFRGAKAKRQNLYQRLDYQRELTSQDLGKRHLVVYNHSGKNVAAAYVDRESISLSFVVDVKLYWGSCDSRAEADYLVAFLNSETVNDRIKPFQSMGLMGERDIHKKVLDLPIPRYDSTNKRHVALATLGAAARRRAALLITSTKLPKSLSQRRGWIRSQLKPTLQEIDQIVAKLL
jgi:hypothetical protein